MAGKTKDPEFRHPNTAAHMQGLTDEEAAEHPPVIREPGGVCTEHWREGGRVRCREVGAGEASGGPAPELGALLAAAVRVLAPDKAERKARMERIKAQLNGGRVGPAVAEPEPHRHRDEAVEDCVRCMEANKDRMRCDACRKRGLPVGSGVAESACKRIVGSRFKRAGCRWSKAGANALPAVKCCIDNNRWAGFLDWRACRAAAA